MAITLVTSLAQTDFDIGGLPYDTAIDVAVSSLTGLADDDVIVCFASIANGASSSAPEWDTVPAGWTVVDTFGTGTGSFDRGMWVAYKVASSESGNYSFASDPSTAMCVHMLVFRGVDTAQVLDVAYVEANHRIDDAATPDQPDITTNTDGAMVAIMMWDGNNSNTTITDPTNYTVAEETVDLGNAISQGTSYREITTATTETIGTWTFDGGFRYTAYTLALRPAAAAGLKAQWDVNTRGRTDDDFYEHINGTLETSTGSPTKDETYAFDGLTFNGTSQYTKISTLPVGLSSTFPDSDFTLAAQIKPSDLTPASPMAILGVYLSGNNTTRIEMHMDSTDGTLIGAMVAQAVAAKQANDTNVTPDDQDRHVVVYRREGGAVNVWLDGAKEASENFTLSTIGTVDTIGIAARTDGDLAADPWYFAGTVYWAAIYDEAISDGAIVALGETSNPFVTAVSASVVEHIAPAYHRRVNPLVRM